MTVIYAIEGDFVPEDMKLLIEVRGHGDAAYSIYRIKYREGNLLL